MPTARMRPTGKGLAFVALAALAAAGPAAANQAEQDYLQHCSGCHMMDGRGSAQNLVPTMLGSVGHFVRTGGGRVFLIQVAGVAQAPISDQAVADLLNWLLPTFGKADMPAQFTPYTAAEVAVARGTRPGDIMAVRKNVAQELAALGYAIANY